MDNSQIIIKILLIAVAAVFAVILLMPVKGARRMAVRRLTSLALFAAAVVAIAFPQLINDLAQMVGVGRGTDLLLYGLIVVFVGNAVSTGAHHRQLQRDITLLARNAALQGTPPPQN